MTRDAKYSFSIYYYAHAQLPPVFFVASPYETYLVAHGYNVSMLLCKFQYWFDILQKCTSKPHVARSWQDPRVLDGIANLHSLYARGVDIAGTVKAGTSHAVDTVLFHRKFLSGMLAGYRPEDRETLTGIEHWVRDCAGSCPEYNFSLQQCMYLADSPRMNEDQQAVASNREWKTENDHSLDKLYESLALKEPCKTGGLVPGTREIKGVSGWPSAILFSMVLAR